MKKILIYFTLLIGLNIQVYAQKRVGDPGVKFDSSKYDSRYPQMKEWQKAGVQGGIPYLSSTPVKKTIGATNSSGINKAINEVALKGGGQVKLKNGTYTINETVKMKSNVRLVGESRNGVILRITKSNGGDGIDFNGVNKAGLDNLRIEGGFGTPNDFKMEESKSSFKVVSVKISGNAKNCWLDGVSIINSGLHPLDIRGNNNTVRSCYIERCWNKSSGWQGYFQLSGQYNLVYDTTIKKIRHFALQDNGCRYNVIYKNKLEQDVNFHDDDDGNNLVEQNTITLPNGLPNVWKPIMGYWSPDHKPSKRNNYLYKNKCKENNNGGRVSFSDNSKVYVGAKHREGQNPFDTTNKTPKGGTFYPIILGSGGGTPPPAPTPSNSSIVHMKKRNASAFAIDGDNGGANKQNVYLWGENRYNGNQQWVEINRGKGYYSYQKKGTNYCLDGGSGGANGQNVYLFTCGNANQNQHWKKVNAGSGNFRLEKRNAPGYAMDGGNGGANGQNVYLWSTSSTNQNQQWTFSKAGGAKPAEEPSLIATAFPNPFSDYIKLQLGNNTDILQISLINIDGKEILSKSIETEISEVELSIPNELTEGMYFIQMIRPGQVETLKIIRSK